MPVGLVVPLWFRGPRFRHWALQLPQCWSQMAMNGKELLGFIRNNTHLLHWKLRGARGHGHM